MDLSLLIRFIFASLTFLLLFYYIWTNYSINKKLVVKTNFINLYLGMLFLLSSYILYLNTILLKEGEEFLAELSFGSSLICAVFGMFFYVEFWNSLYRKNSWLSKLFYLFSGACFILLISHPWQIVYIENYGYSQPISEIFLLTFFLEGLFGIVIFSQCIYNIKTRIEQGTESINTILVDNLTSDKEKNVLLERKIDLQEKNIHLTYIIIFSFLGFILLVIGLLPGTYILDSIGVFIALFPQVYYFSKDKEIFLFLFSQRVQEDFKNLQKNISLLHQSSYVSSDIQPVEIASLVDFIEKSDIIFNEKP